MLLVVTITIKIRNNRTDNKPHNTQNTKNTIMVIIYIYIYM